MPGSNPPRLLPGSRKARSPDWNATGYLVGVARSGTEALVRAAELTPDIVLVDLGLDGESGFDMAAELARGVSCVIILISTHAQEDFEELIAGSPARGFLPKSALSARAIRELLDGDGQASAT
ncbi:response regulator [Streptomyces sviceus]|uniref:response regulator n=1 Tax=Streptomyces sviceus TaxID=285530 RepID=UPI00369EBEB5